MLVYKGVLPPSELLHVYCCVNVQSYLVGLLFEVLLYKCAFAPSEMAHSVSELIEELENVVVVAILVLQVLCQYVSVGLLT